MPGITAENNTGPFRRVLSKPGFAYCAASVFLPERGDIETLMSPDANGVEKLKVSGDTVFVYMGGKGGSGGEVDAGMQFNAASNNWSLFLLAAGGFGFVYGPFPEASPHPRFSANQPVFLEFEVVGLNVLQVRATGKDVTGKTD